MSDTTKSMWKSTYADWDHDDLLLDLDLSKQVALTQKDIDAALSNIAEQIKPFRTPPGCNGCGGCMSCLRRLP